ncbi:laminin G domain-containing protein [Streptomyces yaizuensis]|uniref:Laminin G domain-containing protein n=1 Tax=Streptomyces yaizuensis TaxID=2989713 RepID=A0ABQ5NXY2_9ACTN|nr:laminin G domain-containing protein [Streptomyces sp. YSPA8]
MFRGGGDIVLYAGLEDPGAVPVTDEPTLYTATAAIKRAQLDFVGRAGGVYFTGEGGDVVLAASAAYLADLYRAGRRREAWRHNVAHARVRRVSPLTLWRRVRFLAPAFAPPTCPAPCLAGGGLPEGWLMSTADQSLVKIYSDRTYTHTTMVRHQGTVIAFAVDDARRIVYSVLGLSAYDEKKGELDVAYWSENPAELPFPGEVVKVGYAVAGATAMPVVKKSSRTEAGPAEVLTPEETDPFLSSTARLTAPGAPFQVISDGSHVVVLRQAVGAGQQGAVFALSDGIGSTGNGTGAGVVKSGGTPVPVVDGTLLCDRFLLVGSQLKQVAEVRFKRSRHKTRPASEKDSLGPADMDGKPFFEPTQELDLIRNLSGGRFTAVLTPTAVQGQRRWQFFAHNSATGRVDAFNVEQDPDGLFNTQGSRYWTSPDPKYRGSVYERAPGICPFTGKALVPLVPDTRHAETALQFDGVNNYLNAGEAPALKFHGGAYAVEAWVRPRAAGGPVVARWSGTASQGGFQLRITDTGKVVLDHSGGTLTSDRTISADTWAHIAASFDGTAATLYIDGVSSGSKALPASGDESALLHIGAKAGGPFYSGTIDEVRIWNRARGQSEITDSSAYRLIGNEPGLVAYYRFDEGSGTTAYDQTDTAAHATLESGPQWVTSLAPLGDHPGVRRDSFTVDGRDIVSGLAATLYYQQEDAASGYRADVQPVKRQARVLLAFATRPAGDAAAEAYLASVDFGVGIDGRLADIPDVVTLTELGLAQEQSIDKVTAQQELIGKLEQQLTALEQTIADLTADAPLDAEFPDDGDGSKLWYVTLGLGRGLNLASMGPNLDSRYWWLSANETGGSWWLMPIPEVTGRYGNPCVAVVFPTDFGLYTLGTGDRGDFNTQNVLTDPVPESARWYVKGSFPSSFRLQYAPDDSWLSFGNSTKVPNESDAVVITAVKKAVGPDPRVVALKSEIKLAQGELNRMSASLIGTADLALSQTPISVDASGLSCAGGLLKFARTDTAPFLMDGAAGRVALYFRGTNSQFFAAYLDTGTVRGVQQLAGGVQTLLFTARDPGVDLTAGTVISITDSTAGDRLCDLKITRGEDSETFPGLPRSARVLAAVVNGIPGESVPVGTVASVQGTTVTLAAGSPVALPAAGYLRIGEAVHQVAAAVDLGGTTVTVAVEPSSEAAGAIVSLVPYDISLATASRPGASLAGGSQWVTVSAATVDAAIPNGTAAVRVTGHGSRWRADSPGRAFAFDGKTQFLALPDGLLDQVTTPAGDLSTEVWINPATLPGARARILQLNRGQTRTALTLIPGDPVPGGMLLDGVNDALLIGSAVPAQTDFTIECWLQRTAERTTVDTIVADGTSGLTIGFTPEGNFSFGFGKDSAAELLTTTTATTDGTWHHWAVTFNHTTLDQVIHRDGVEVARRTATAPPARIPQLIVGRTDSGGSATFFSGRLAELRTWSTARSAADTEIDRFRRATPGEPGLTGAWIYDKNRPSTTSADGQPRFADISANNHHGGVWGNDPTAVASALTTYRVQAAVGDKVRAGRESYPCGEWAHLAAVYEQSWGLRFDGSSWAETPDADALDLTEDLTIEVFAAIDTIGARQGLISKGRLADGSGGSVPYQFSIRPDGKLEFAFEEPDSVIKRFTSTTAVTTGFHRLAVVRKAGKSTEEIKSPKDITYKDADGKDHTQSVDVVDRVDTKTWDDITFTIDGTAAGTGRYTGPGPRGNDGPLEIGRVREGTAIAPLTGTIGEVRIWAKARDTTQLGTPIQLRDEGLIARWTFEENTGNTTADPIGGYDLKLRGARWTTDPDPRAATFTLYRNGQPIPTDTPTTSPLGGWGDDQLTLGALKTNGTFGDFYTGSLEEVRLWRTARTPEQILDSLFTRLKGDKQDLLAYWPFDTDPTAGTATTPETAALQDQSQRSNNLDPGTDTTQPPLTLSTAPVSTDTAAVRSALAGVRTPFHELISTPPAAAEYADVQYTATGETHGVLKRAYTHLKEGTWHLTTGYKVGDLISEWVSQVQYDPQLIGYIEGAPPVPSENLTSTVHDPEGCSSVTFRQAETVTSTLSSDTEKSVNTAFHLAAGVEVDEHILLLTAPLGFGTAEPLAQVTVRAKVGGSLEFSNAWTDETSVSQGTTTERDTSATLTGHWEDKDHILNQAIGQRYVPANTGYALVQSETADVYALRLAHSGALVAYRMLPNPDIPKDWNIIDFPLNPQYTKQGTLDGAVGFDEHGKVLDPAYPNARGYGDYSYFKPREAYALKRRILRESQELESYYNNVSTDTGDSDPTAGRAQRLLESFSGPLPPAPDKNPPSQSQDAFANRNIANTYVWTADGGFFAESTSTVDVVTQTTGGSYSLSGSVTASVDIGFEIAGVGAGIQFDASIGGGMTVTRHSSKESTRTHSLDITCNPTRDLQKYDTAGKPQYDAGKPVLVPGKVDAYRFMTFYLGQDNTHFDDFYNKVADPTWLANSNDAAAAALRQARQSDTKPPCWRILHRVTYISRILPPVPPTDAPPVDKALRDIDIPSNYQLIQRLDPYTSTATGSLGDLANATRNALTAHLPQLLPHTTEIVQFLADYYGIDG